MSRRNTSTDLVVDSLVVLRISVWTHRIVHAVGGPGVGLGLVDAGQVAAA